MKLTAQEARRIRYELRDDLGDVTEMGRIRACGRRRTGEGVEVRTVGGHAYFAGVQTCGSAWVCPVCAAKIRVRRAGEIERGVRNWLAKGGGVLFVTYTVPHTNAQPLAWLLSGVAGAFGQMNEGRARVAEWKRYGIVGTVRSLEITRGENGWHPHLHVLYFTKARLSEHEAFFLEHGWRERWATKVQAMGLARPGWGIGVVSRLVLDEGEGLGEYLSKLGLEVAAPDTKSGRKGSSLTPFGVLREALTGEAKWVARWHEYERATKRRQSITFSRGLAALLGIEDKSDEALAAEDVGGDQVLIVPAEVWDRAIAPAAGRRLELLVAVEHGGVLAGELFLRRAWQERPRRRDRYSFIA